MRKDFAKTGAFLKGFACNYSICNYGGPNVTSVSIKTYNMQYVTATRMDFWCKWRNEVAALRFFSRQDYSWSRMVFLHFLTTITGWYVPKEAGNGLSKQKRSSKGVGGWENQLELILCLFMKIYHLLIFMNGQEIFTLKPQTAKPFSSLVFQTLGMRWNQSWKWHCPSERKFCVLLLMQKSENSISILFHWVWVINIFQTLTTGLINIGTYRRIQVEAEEGCYQRL